MINIFFHDYACKVRWPQLFLFARDFITFAGANAFPSTFSQLPQNKKLNRYNNIIPYDHSRVKVVPTKVAVNYYGNNYVLSWYSTAEYPQNLQANGNNDYLNGNFLKGQNGTNTYIASQAPVPESFPS